MAVIEDLGLEVEILVDNSPLQEYNDEEDDTTDDGFSDDIRKCRRYVEVVEDAEFGLQICATPTNNYLNDEKQPLLFVVDLDGHKGLQSQLLDSEENKIWIQGKDEFDDQTGFSCRNFRFSTVATVDDDDKERVREDEKTAKGLGLIRVRVFRVEPIETYLPSVPAQVPEFDEIENEFAEKALKGKALSHRATLSAPVQTDGFTSMRIEYLDPAEAPLAIFYFKYRSKAALQDEMIIPRSREASHQPNPDESLSLTEVRRLASERLNNMPYHELLRVAGLQYSGIKEENTAPLRPAVKREQSEAQLSERPQKTVKISGDREAIDLTEDD